MARPKGIPKTGGRKRGSPNKITKDVRALAQTHGEEAIGVLVGIMNNGEVPPDTRIKATQELLSRGYGKPVEYREETILSERDAAKDLTDAELTEALKKYGIDNLKKP